MHVSFGSEGICNAPNPLDASGLLPVVRDGASEPQGRFVGRPIVVLGQLLGNSIRHDGQFCDVLGLHHASMNRNGRPVRAGLYDTWRAELARRVLQVAKLLLALIVCGKQPSKLNHGYDMGLGPEWARCRRHARP